MLSKLIRQDRIDVAICAQIMLNNNGHIDDNETKMLQKMGQARHAAVMLNGQFDYYLVVGASWKFGVCVD